MTPLKLDKEELKILLRNSEKVNNSSNQETIKPPVNKTLINNKQIDPSIDTNLSKKEPSSLKTKVGGDSGLNPFSNQAEREEAIKDSKRSEFDPKRLMITHRQIRENGYDHLPNEIYAGFWVRLAAYIVDYLLIFLISNILKNIIGGIDRDILWGNLPMLFDLMVFCLYFFLMSLILKGQTPGKILFDLRVVPINSDNDKLTISTLLVREFFGRIIFYFVPIIAIILIFTSKHQHPLDMLTDTAVVNERYLTAFAKWKLA